jgi:hypothetical protein
VHTVRRLTSLLVLLAGEVAAVVLLARLGRREPFAIPFDDVGNWVRATDPADAVVALIRLVALVAAGWLLLTTLIYMAARATDTSRALRALEWATLPTVRRVVDRALVFVAVGALVSPASAVRLASSSTTGTVRDGRSGSSVSTATTPPTAPATATRVPAAPVPSSATRDATVVVAPGDNLWSLAAAQLAATTGRARATLDDGEIARYWAVVCDANRARVRSGDVNLIYPGELIVLPALA